MRKSNAKKDIEAVKQYIERHYCEPITLEQLAVRSGLSATYLSSIYKQMYEVTPTEYVTQLRMIKAKQLMTNQKLRIKDIAAEVGFSDEFYFSRVFKKQEGTSPTKYKKFIAQDS